MFKINKKVEYALMVLKHLYKKRDVKLITAKEFSAAYSLPHNLVAKIFQQLSHHGVLQSEKGAHGGYRLIRPLDDISMRELNRMMTEQSELAACLDLTSQKNCELVCHCHIISPIAELNKRLNRLLDAISVLDLIRVPKGYKEEQIVALVSANQNHLKG